ncbi:PAS domain-containing sensor histidine kinase [Brevibacillus massiliensis]|uniref:PAS domain-containing sensor histidine kinase n=1 Tax=Brevibacillus massiliensis TaxID=1118054 RepID=UPI00030AA56B
MKTKFSFNLFGSFRKMEQFMQQLPYAVLLSDQSGRIIECNEALLRVTGYTRQEIVGHHINVIIPCQGTMEQLYREWTNKEDLWESPAEVEWLDKSGKTGRTNVMVLVQDAEDPLYLVHLVNLAKDSNDSLPQRLVTQLASDIYLGIVVLDRAAKIIEISQMACRLLGVERFHVLNQHIDKAFEGIPEEHRLIKRELLKGIKLQNKAMSWTNNSQRYELLVNSNTLHDEAGRIVGAYVLFKDVTNLRSFEQKIERSDRLAMIGQIAAGTAHEIRNPLTSIKGFLQLFLQSFGESGMERERTYTEIMLTEINRINSLVSEFLLLSKQRDVQYQIVDLNTVFEEILPIVNSEALLHGIDVQYLPAGQLPMVVGDTELLKQVFLNICKNGIEAMEKEGVLSISHHLDVEGDKISIDIHDTGPGIPAYVIDKIFDPFFTTKEEGTGLGLSVCQKIIHDLGGQIRVSSKGYGTSFHILLPYI